MDLSTSKSKQVFLQWFTSLQDVNPEFLEIGDYLLAIDLYKQTGQRIPNSVITFIADYAESEMQKTLDHEANSPAFAPARGGKAKIIGYANDEIRLNDPVVVDHSKKKAVWDADKFLLNEIVRTKEEIRGSGDHLLLPAGKELCIIGIHDNNKYECRLVGVSNSAIYSIEGRYLESVSS